MKSDPSVYQKRAVGLSKTSRCFMKSDLSFYQKRAVVFEK